LRAHKEIARVRSEKQGEELLDQLLWRIKLLGGDVDLTDGENREAFADVLDAFVPENHRLIFDPSARCRATLDCGGEIVFTGVLVSGGNATAELERRLYLGRREADHRRIRVVPSFRGNRIAPRSLIRCVGLYDLLRFERVRLRACFSGTWYWAQWGFHFEDKRELEHVQEHAQTIIDAFGGGQEATSLTHPSQFYRLGESEERPGDPVKITFDELCDALPRCREAYEEMAYDNGIGMHDPIPFGRIVLLTGPSWFGCLDLDGGDRLIFNDRAKRVLSAEGAA
jgi:hypothetical protein